MTKVLYIHANPKPEDQSFSKSVAREFLNAYKAKNANAEITELDLYSIDLPYIDAEVFAGWGKLAGGAEFNALSDSEKAKVGRLGELVEQFTSHDLFVWATPMWNFSFPPLVKAYIDSICVAGKTFKYTAEGPVGLLGGKTAVHIQARGGVYSEGPAADVEFGDRYLRAVNAFVGITDYHSVAIEGHAAFPDQADAIKQKAIAQAKDLAASLK